jgi:hypothetical protein
MDVAVFGYGALPVRQKNPYLRLCAWFCEIAVNLCMANFGMSNFCFREIVHGFDTKT